MKTEQLYARGNPICPETNYEKENAADKIKALEARAEQIQGMIDEIVDRVANRLLERAEIAEWAMQEAKPSYTAAEIGADEEGSAESALMAAKEYSDSTYRQAAAYTDREIAGLIDGADDTLDTLGEIAAAVRSNESVVAALHNAIGTKASDVELQAHMSNGTVHITQGERNGWDAAVAKLSGIADGADAVSFRRTLTAGTKIGTITGLIRAGKYGHNIWGCDGICQWPDGCRGQEKAGRDGGRRGPDHHNHEPDGDSAGSPFGRDCWACPGGDDRFAKQLFCE